ncbi:ricin-type beta-trefoil lectin domain protein [Kribbella ginsengisoli]|uniref:Ricin B lectin domain-containing protein n=1 Tax=Kribbella ginsengisoli TaxID=363865 RepID=A0ABP6Z863_9ACTN
MLRTTRRLLALTTALLAATTLGTTTATADPQPPPFRMNLVNQNSGLCLTGTDASQNFAVLQLPCNGSNSQQWESSWTAYYMKDVQTGRCLSTLLGTGQLKTVDCWWNGPESTWYEASKPQTWNFSGNPTQFNNRGLCLGILPGNSWVRALDCNSGSTTVWYR